MRKSLNTFFSIQRAKTLSPTGSNWIQPTPTGTRRVVESSLEWRRPIDHALQLIKWLQAEDGRTATISAQELSEIHREMCLELLWEPASWISVARELRRHLKSRKEYTRVNGRKVRVYRIPRADCSTGPSEGR